VPEHERLEPSADSATTPSKAMEPGAQTPVQLALMLQRTVGNAATTRLLQREVRIDGGATRVDEAFYKTGAGRTIGTRRRVSSLIDDPLKRVFTSDQELRDFANGAVDHIGDVATRSAGTFWFRLPPDRLTVLGEMHQNSSGNVEDVIMGLGTSRFMYEPFNYAARVGNIGVQYGGTETRLSQAHGTYRVNARVDRTRYNPELENIIVKAMVGASITRNEYIAASPRSRAGSLWASRPTTDDYSYGERAALYLSFAIHIASDLMATTFPAATPRDSRYLRAARALQTVFTTHQQVLERLMRAKDADELIGIHDLTSQGDPATLRAVAAFARCFHEYGSRYIEQLGIDTRNPVLERQGRALERNPTAQLDRFSPVREEIMWQNIELARLAGIDYLLVGMGDAHRVNLAPRLNAAGIPHFEVSNALVDQEAEINRRWVP
jgi:hypothetical protein